VFAILANDSHYYELTTPFQQNAVLHALSTLV